MSWSERQALKRFGETVPTLTNRFLYWILYLMLLLWVTGSSLLVYRFGEGPTILVLFIVVAVIIPPVAQSAYEIVMRHRFRHLLQDATLSTIKISAQKRTGVALADEVWLRNSTSYFVIPVTTLSGNAIVVSQRALEMLKAGPEKAEIILADRLFRLKASDARFRLVFATVVWAGAYLIATVMLSWLGLASFMYMPIGLVMLIGLPSLIAASIFGLFLIGPAVWSDNPGKTSVRGIYGVFAVVAENELINGRTLTPDERNAVLDRARRDELSRRAERRSILSLLSAALAVILVLRGMPFFQFIGYLYMLSALFLIGVPAGVLFGVMIAAYAWDRRCTHQNWGFTSETQEPIWMD